MNATALLTTAALARELGVDRNVPLRWSHTDKRLASCIVRRSKRRTYWSRQFLTERGYLTRSA